LLAAHERIITMAGPRPRDRHRARLAGQREVFHVPSDTTGVFISYRRDESSHFAGRLYDRFAERLGEPRVFMDVDSIMPGEDWTEAIRGAVARCGLMLVLIGPRWGEISKEGHRRIDSPDDPHRLEIEAAFDHDIPVIPVLLENAAIPRAIDLPDSLARLSHLQAIRMRHESFRSDSAWLLTVVEEVLGGQRDAALHAGRRQPTSPSGPMQPGARDTEATRASAKLPPTAPSRSGAAPRHVRPRLRKPALHMPFTPKVVVPLLVLIAVAAVAFAAVILLGPRKAAAIETLEPIKSVGDHPYLPGGGQDRETTPPANAGGGSVRGDEPGLYGGTLDVTSCDAQGILFFLEDHPDKAAAWAGVEGIASSQISTFMAQLTPLILRTDTRVTNHGFVDGHATTIPAVLQAGTAVLVDSHGTPAAKCYCGNPLTPPQANPHPNYKGTRWPGFLATRVTVIEPAATVITSFTVVNLSTGQAATQRTGTAIRPGHEGPTPSVSPSAGSTPPSPGETPTPTQTPAPTGTGGAGGSGGATGTQPGAGPNTGDPCPATSERGRRVPNSGATGRAGAVLDSGARVRCTSARRRWRRRRRGHRAGKHLRCIDPLVGVVEAWLRAYINPRGSVIHERLVECGYDASYAGKLLDWTRDTLRITVQIVKRSDDVTGFVVLPRRWVVERSLAWITRHRRCARDYEALPTHHEAMVRWAIIRITSRRLTRP